MGPHPSGRRLSRSSATIGIIGRVATMSARQSKRPSSEGVRGGRARLRRRPAREGRTGSTNPPAGSSDLFDRLGAAAGLRQHLWRGPTGEWMRDW